MNDGTREPHFGNMVRAAIKTAGLSRHHRNRAVVCATYLDAVGWFNERHEMHGNDYGAQEWSAFLDHATRDAFEECQQQQLIPSGRLVSVFWRWTLCPFLRALTADVLNHGKKTGI